MKSRILLSVIMLGIGLPGLSLSEEEIASKKEVSKVMAEVWCSKMEQCVQSSEMGPKECRKVLNKSFLSGFDNVPDGQKIEVSKSTLKQCQESITKDTCEALKTAQTLPGCNFITYLNRS